MNIASKIQALRKERNLTQENLADQLNVSRQALSKWELGISTPEADKIIQISEYFNVSTDYLLKDSIENVQPSVKKQFSSRPLIVISTAGVLIGLILMIAVWEYAYLGFIIQIIAIATIELLMGRQPIAQQRRIRSVFYGINVWLILFVPYILLFRRMEKFNFQFLSFKDETAQFMFMFGSYVTLCMAVTLSIYASFKKIRFSMTKKANGNPF